MKQARTAWAALALLAVLYVAASSEPCPDGKRFKTASSRAHCLHVLGDKARTSGQFGLAMQLFQNASELEPSNVAHAYARGVAALEAGSARIALESFSAATAIDPRAHRVILHRARLHLWLGQPALARVHADEAVRVRPEARQEADAVGKAAERLERALAQAREQVAAQQFARGHALLAQILRTSPFAAYVAEEMAACSLARGLYEPAALEAGLAIRIARAGGPGGAEGRQPARGFALRGFAFYRMGDFEMAERHFRTGYATDPDDKTCVTHLKYISRIGRLMQEAQGAWREERWAQAAAAFSALAAVDPEYELFNSNMLVSACEAAMKAEDVEGALEACEAAVRLDTTLITGWSLLGEAYASAGDYEAALGCYQRAAGLAPSDPAVFEGLNRTRAALAADADPDLYALLGVYPNASTADIKRSYRKLALQWHPDKHKHKRFAEFKFRRITVAYKILSDPRLRAEYDRKRGIKSVVDEDGLAPAGGGGGGAFSFSFGGGFGFGFGPPPDPPPEPEGYWAFRFFVHRFISGMLFAAGGERESGLVPQEHTVQEDSFRVVFESEEQETGHKYRLASLRGSGTLNRFVAVVGFADATTGGRTHRGPAPVNNIIPAYGSFSVAVHDRRGLTVANLGCAPCDFRFQNILQNGLLIAEGVFVRHPPPNATREGEPPGAAAANDTGAAGGEPSGAGGPKETPPPATEEGPAEASPTPTPEEPPCERVRWTFAVEARYEQGFRRQYYAVNSLLLDWPCHPSFS